MLRLKKVKRKMRKKARELGFKFWDYCDSVSDYYHNGINTKDKFILVLNYAREEAEIFSITQRPSWDDPLKRSTLDEFMRWDRVGGTVLCATAN